MVITVKKNWYVVRFQGLVFCGGNRLETICRALTHVYGKEVA